MVDRGIVSLFEIDRPEVQGFVNQLKIKSKSGPAIVGPGNPCINGYNVWPRNSPTAVAGNIGKLRRTWRDAAVPIEMLSCASPKGDWLHVEIWSLGDHALIKVYTDWN